MAKVNKPINTSTCHRVVDGDTYEGDLNIFIEQLNATMTLHDVKFRLKGTDTPERKEKFYSEAKQFSKEKIEGKTFPVNLYGRDNFGRWLVDALIERSTLNQMLIDENLAVSWKPGHGNKLKREV